MMHRIIQVSLPATMYHLIVCVLSEIKLPFCLCYVWDKQILNIKSRITNQIQQSEVHFLGLQENLIPNLEARNFPRDNPVIRKNINWNPISYISKFQHFLFHKLFKPIKSTIGNLLSNSNSMLQRQVQFRTSCFTRLAIETCSYLTGLLCSLDNCRNVAWSWEWT